MATQRITIDLKKNPKVAEMIADLEPADSLFAELTIVSKDEQSLVVEIEATGLTHDDLAGEDQEEDDNESEDDADKEKEKSDATTYGT